MDAALNLRRADYGESFNIGSGQQDHDRRDGRRRPRALRHRGSPRLLRCRAGSWDVSDWYADNDEGREGLGWKARTRLPRRARGRRPGTAGWRTRTDTSSSSKKFGLDTKHSVIGRHRLLPGRSGDPDHVRAAEGDVRKAQDRLRDHLRQRLQPRRLRGRDPRASLARPPRDRHLALPQFRLAVRLPQRDGARDEERLRPAGRRPAGSARADRTVRGAVARGLRRGLRPARRAGGALFMQFAYKAFYRVFDAFSYVPIPRDAGDFSLIDRRVVERDAAVPRARFLPARRARLRRLQADRRRLLRPERMFGAHHQQPAQEHRLGQEGHPLLQLHAADDPELRGRPCCSCSASCSPARRWRAPALPDSAPGVTTLAHPHPVLRLDQPLRDRPGRRVPGPDLRGGQAAAHFIRRSIVRGGEVRPIAGPPAT